MRCNHGNDHVRDFYGGRSHRLSNVACVSALIMREYWGVKIVTFILLLLQMISINIPIENCRYFRLVIENDLCFVFHRKEPLEEKHPTCYLNCLALSRL